MGSMMVGSMMVVRGSVDFYKCRMVFLIVKMALE
jgi:hypothetical protein